MLSRFIKMRRKSHLLMTLIYNSFFPNSFFYTKTILLLWLHLHKATERRRREKGNRNILNVRPEKRPVKGLRFGVDFGRAINTSVFTSFPVDERVTGDSEDPCSPSRPSPITVSTHTICVYWGQDFANKWVICQSFLLVSTADNGFMRLKKRSTLNFFVLP